MVKFGKAIIGINEFPGPVIVGAKLELDNIHKRIRWDPAPTPGKYNLIVNGISEGGKMSADSELMTLKLTTSDIAEIPANMIEANNAGPVATATTPATEPPAAAPAETPAVTALVPPPVKPVPSVPVATVAPAAGAKPAPVSGIATALARTIKGHLQSVKSSLEKEPRIMGMSMTDGLKHEHAETCGDEFKRIVDWASSLSQADQGNERLLNKILNQTGCLMAAVMDNRRQIEDQNERHAARSAKSPIAPAPQPEIQPATAASAEPVKPAQAPATPPPVLRPAAAAIQTPPPVIQERPAVAQENVPPPAIPQIPAGTPVPTRVPKRFGGHKVVAMLLALIAFLAFLFAFGVVVYAMYRSNSPWVGPVGTGRNQSSDAERVAIPTVGATTGLPPEIAALKAPNSGVVYRYVGLPRIQSVDTCERQPVEPVQVQPPAQPVTVVVRQPYPYCDSCDNCRPQVGVAWDVRLNIDDTYRNDCYYPSYPYTCYRYRMPSNFHSSKGGAHSGRYRHW
jgi:hypothetical protein